MVTRTPGLAPVLLLVALALGAGCTGAQSAATHASPMYTDLAVEEFRQMVDQYQGRAGEATILDVRTAGEFEGEHLAGAVNLDVNTGVFRDRVARLDRGRTYLIYCQSGIRSANAAGIMAELGFSRIYTMRGGIAKWKAAGYPVIAGY